MTKTARKRCGRASISSSRAARTSDQSARSSGCPGRSAVNGAREGRQAWTLSATRKATRCSHPPTDVPARTWPAFRMRVRKVAWNASSASGVRPSTRRQVPRTIGPCRQTSSSNEVSSRSSTHRASTSESGTPAWASRLVARRTRATRSGSGRVPIRPPLIVKSRAAVRTFDFFTGRLSDVETASFSNTPVRQARPAGSDVALARPRRVVAHPEGEQAGGFQVESEADDLARGRADICLLPGHRLLRFFRPPGDGVDRRKSFDRIAALVHDLGGQLAFFSRGVDEQMLARELHRPRGECPARLASVERRESVAAQNHEPGAAAAVPLVPFPGAPGPAAVIEVKFVPDDKAASAGRLHVPPIPVAGGLRDAVERTPVRPVPIEAIAAEPDANIVRLRPAGGLVQISAPDGEQPEEKVFIGDAVEVVEFGNDLQVVA